MSDIFLCDWFPLDKLDCVALLYVDGTYLLVSRVDFNRAFGCIVSASKSDVERDFALYKLNG